MSAIANKLIEVQKLLFEKLHPSFVKGAISICIGILTFWLMNIDSDEANKIFTERSLWWIKLAIGTLAMGMNQFRDAISAYYGDKTKQGNSSNPAPSGTDNNKPS